MVTRRYLKFVVSITLLFFFASVQLASAKDSIVIGGSRALSGPLAFYEAVAYGPVYKMWAEDVNAKGGIYVKEYKKKLPIELKIYDNKSEMGTMTRQLEKLIMEDKVDFIIAPPSTAFLFAAAGVANRYKKVLIGAEGGATTMEREMSKYPYLFMVLGYANHFQCPALAEIYHELGIKTVAVLFVEDLHGIEYQGVGLTEFASKGIEVKMIKGVPFGAKDVSLQLKEAKKFDVDALVCFTYPDINNVIVTQLLELGMNFKAIMLGPGGNFEIFRKTFGDAVIEGIMGEGAWNEKSSPAAKAFVEKFLKKYPREALDWWGHLVYYGSLEVLEQAIQRAGTLDNTKVRNVIATQKFKTIIGNTYFKNNLLPRECYVGQIGQWQKGIFEVIDTDKFRTAKPIYPKPDFPKATKK